MTKNNYRRMPQIAAFFSLIIFKPVVAQVPSYSGSQPETLAEVVVTAQRRSESLQDVPIAVTALGSARLEALGIQDTADLGELAPGLSVPETNGNLQPHIRGVGTSTTGPGVENPVALYIDGAYIASGPSSIMSLSNIDRIEVDKGPQGTLFGRNATGGLIQVITRDPQPTPHLDADLSYANYDDVTGRLYATDALTDALFADVAVRYEHQGNGYGHNLFDRSEVGTLPHDLAVRSKFLFEPSADTQVRLALDYEDRATTRDIFHLGSQYPGAFNNAFFGGPYPQGGPYDVNQNERWQGVLQGGGAALKINQNFAAVTLESISAYRQAVNYFDVDLDFTPLPILASTSYQKDEQATQELRLSGLNSGKLKWTAGLYYFYARDGWQPININFGPTLASPVPNVPVTAATSANEITNSAAGYGQASYEVAEHTNLTLGGRYTYERKTVDGTESLLVDGVPASVTPYPTPGLGIPSRITFDNFSYRIALDHKFNPDILGYVSYSTGFKSGGFNLSSGTNPPYKPEDIKAAEVGLKSELFERRLRINVAAYNYLYNNIQVGQYIVDTEIIVNGAKAKIYGADVDAELAVVHGLTLNAGASYIHDRFLQYPDAGFIVPVNGCVPPPGGLCAGSAAGNKLPFTPTASFNLGGDYKWELRTGAITISANYFHSGSFYGAADNVAMQKAYGLVNASVSWSDSSDHLTAGLYGRNLGNTVYATSVNEGSPGEIIELGMPRTYGVKIGYKF